MKTYITGHSGFIGSHLLNALRRAGHEVMHAGGRLDLADMASLEKNFSGQDVIIHCAGFAHADDDGSAAFIQQHQQINFHGTVNIVEAAVRTGVKRLVFISSAKAVADAPDQIIDETFSALPETPYGKAKRAAEEALLQQYSSRIEIVIIRPVMVYGRNGGGNLPRMLDAIRRHRFPPLPVGGKRSLLHIDDLVAALILAATHPAAAGNIYFVAHPQAATTQEISRYMHRLLQLPEQRWAIPVAILFTLAAVGDVLGKMRGRPLPFNRTVYKKLMQPAIYSAEKISRELGWQAHVDLEQGLRTLQAIKNKTVN